MHNASQNHFPKSICLFLCTMLIFHQANSDLIENLKKVCPSLEALKANYEIEHANRKREIQQPNNLNQVVSEGISKKLANKKSQQAKRRKMINLMETSQNMILVQNFARNLTLNPRQIGTGAFGGVFSFKNHQIVDEYRDMEMAVKLLKLNKNIASPSIQMEQGRVYREILMSYNLYHKPGGKYYFPLMLGCNQITNEVVPLISEIPKKALYANQVLRYVKGGFKAKEFVIVKLEKLDYPFQAYLAIMNENGKIGMLILDRIRISLNLFTGLQLINEKSLHCDIKPDNLMIRSVDASMMAKDAPLVYTTSGDSILVKYIDFGMTVPRDERCRGGTYGYMGPEMFLQDVSHSKIDVFSLGVILVEAEMAMMLNGRLSDVLREIMSFQFKKKKMIGALEKTKLQSLAFVKEIMTNFDDKNKQKIIDYLKILQTTYENQSLDFQAFLGDNRDISKITIENLDIFDYTFEFLTATFLKLTCLYLKRIFSQRFEVEFSHHVESLDKRKLDLMSKIDKLVNSKEYITAVLLYSSNIRTAENLEYKLKYNEFMGMKRIYENKLVVVDMMLNIEISHVKFRSLFLGILMNMIEFHPLLRTDISENLAKLQALKREYEEYVFPRREKILKYQNETHGEEKLMDGYDSIYMTRQEARDYLENRFGVMIADAIGSEYEFYHQKWLRLI